MSDNNRNTGYRNTGYRNTGDRNTGNCNTGYCNTGDWNTGNRNTGYLCTKTPTATFFDMPTDLTHEDARRLIPQVDLSIGVEWIASSDMSDAEKVANPNHATIGGYLKKHELPLCESFPPVWKTLDDKTKQRFTDLPNFDADKFLAITGVDVRVESRSHIADEIDSLSQKMADMKAELEKLQHDWGKLTS